MTARPRVLAVSPEDAGQRLDVFLATRLALSRSQVRRLLERGAVSVAGRPVVARAKGARVDAGAEVQVAPFTRPDGMRVVPTPAAPLAVLAEGRGWVAVDKPPGVPVHPLDEDESGTALNALVARHPELQGVGEGGLRSGVVHRLDVDTSGALLFALDASTWQGLRAAFAEHRVEKVYRALVVGHPPAEGDAEVGLVTARHRPARVRVLAPGAPGRGARVCSLRWRALERLPGATLLEVRPRTGHLHQIRVTLAHLGHPVAGDRVYGAREDATGAPRQMLHAARVACGEVLAESPDPEDLRAVLARLRAAAAGVSR